jgi:hypothetical protein
LIHLAWPLSVVVPPEVERVERLAAGLPQAELLAVELLGQAPWTQ